MSKLLSPVLLSVFVSWFTVQCLKTIIQGVVKKSLHGVLDVLATLVWRTGGMPSSHAALVTALTVSIGIYQGTSNTLFILSLCFAFVVIRDSLGVRLAAGRQAQALNKLGKSLREQMKVDFQVVKEVHGHTPLEVLVGTILGAGIAVIVCTLVK